MKPKPSYFSIFNSCLKVTICFFMMVFFCNNIACTQLVDNSVRVGAADFNKFLPLLDGKKVGIVANQTTTVNGTHLVDSLLSIGIEIEMVFSPEHGFRGKADAGEKVENEIDPLTGISIVSLYGKSKRKPSSQLLGEIDIMIFDLQDVGVRFYTYISTMHYIMEACAENTVPLLILDRPNPNGFYVDGPVLKSKYKSFVGMHPVPVVHGMTIGEYAKMVNGEKWLKDSIQCELKVIECTNYDHSRKYILPVPPSPNLPNMTSVYLYPSLCFFEGSTVSIGRGTGYPFQVYGAPYIKNSSFRFTPKSSFGAKFPKHINANCFGEDLRLFDTTSFFKAPQLNFNWLLDAFHSSKDEPFFFLKNGFFNLLTGDFVIREMIEQGRSEKEIKSSYQDELQQFKKIRKKYLIYKDFE
jgi:uncharacterized protein YbbC (DUF1343 family)